MDEWDVVLLGDGGVGKTALVTQFTLNSWIETYDPTIFDGFRKQFVVDNRMCFLKVIDTAGQEEYVVLLDEWIRESQGIILVYAINSRTTFDRLEVFRQTVKRSRRGRGEPIMLLLGNKSDKLYEREVSFEEGAALAQAFGCGFFEVSAKTAQNVELAFMTLVRALRQAPSPSPATKGRVWKLISRLFRFNAPVRHRSIEPEAVPRQIDQQPPNSVNGKSPSRKHSPAIARTPSSSALVYQNLLTFISSSPGPPYRFNFCPADFQLTSSRIGNIIFTSGTFFHANTDILALLESRGMRTKLLQVAADRGLFGQAKLREALRADEEQLTARIMTTLESQAAREALFELEGLSAQTVIDVLQDILEKGHLLDKRSHTKARRFMIKLSASFDKLPSGLFISGVTAKDDHPLFTGGFADIFQGSVAGKKIALKRIRILYHDEVQRQIRTEICKEALVWQTLQHLSILPFMGIDQDTFPGYLCLASPWMEQGTILKHLKSHGPANLGRLLFEIADGLQYLHSQNIVHGDLRGANILISNEWRACLADFGLASFSDVTASTTTSHNRAGSLRWMAPELINPEKFGQRFLRTPATDVYAFGCVCLELYTGEPPFAGLRETAVILKVSEGVRPERPTCDPAMSDSLWELVNNCWEQQSADRPLSEIVCQNFISTN